jgi:hypothetical protein
MTSRLTLAIVCAKLLAVIPPLGILLLESGVSRTASAAPIVRFGLDLSTPGSFRLYANTSTGDNAGLAAFSVPLSGTVTSVDNVAPFLVLGQKGGFVGGVGFGTLRSADSAVPIVNPLITGLQDVTNAQAPTNLIYGIGQQAGSFTAAGFTPLFTGTDPQSWANPVLLASGTYSGPPSLHIDTNSPNFAAYVFSTVGQTSAPAATAVSQLYCIDCVRVFGGNIGNVDPNDPGAVMTTLTASSDTVVGPYSWSFYHGFSSYQPAPGASGTGPAVQPTIDPTTGKFSWNTVGSPLGAYNWTVEAGNGFGEGLGSVTVKLVPEPSALSTVGLAMMGCAVLVRRRRA